MKKLLALVLSLLMVLTAASAMAKTDIPDLSGLEGIARFEEPVQISFARTMDPTVLLDDTDPEKKSYTENRWINTFKDVLNVEVTFDWITSADDDTAKWGAAIAIGNLPDAGIVSEEVYKQLVEAGLVYDCTELFANEACEKYKSYCNEDLLANMTYGGKLYGLPIPGNYYIGNALLFVRGDWLKQLNLEVPTTIDEAIEVARAFKEAKLGGEDTIGMMFADGAGVNDGRIQGFMNGFDAYRDIWVDVDGKLAFSNTLPEMREALLKLQEMYAEGLINKDFSVTNGTVAQEYIASGKCGIFYSTDYATTMSMQALHDLNPEAEIICVGIPGLTADAETKVQTGAIVALKMFINKDCEHPEAVIRMMNLHVGAMTNSPESAAALEVDTDDSFLWYKLLPWNGVHILPATNDIWVADDVRVWQETGVENYRGANSQSIIEACKDPASPWWYLATFGKDASYTYDYDMYMAGRQLPNAFSTVPTETMAMLGDVVNDALNTAMLEVIMGADISTYDKAVENWFTSGGQQITDEVNEWYASK